MRKQMRLTLVFSFLGGVILALPPSFYSLLIAGCLLGTAWVAAGYDVVVSELEEIQLESFRQAHTGIDTEYCKERPWVTLASVRTRIVELISHSGRGDLRLLGSWLLHSGLTTCLQAFVALPGFLLGKLVQAYISSI